MESTMMHALDIGTLNFSKNILIVFLRFGTTWGWVINNESKFFGELSERGQGNRIKKKDLLLYAIYVHYMN